MDKKEETFNELIKKALQAADREGLKVSVTVKPKRKQDLRTHVN